jgi:hypothetical protein
MPILPGNAGDLPRLGFGLWRAPTASMLVELALVVAGAWLYWRAAVQTSTPDTRRTHLLGLLVLGAGVVTLALDAVVAVPGRVLVWPASVPPLPKSTCAYTCCPAAVGPRGCDLGEVMAVKAPLTAMMRAPRGIWHR